jgi:glycerol-3-phosphate acyltransferase PlsY
MFNFILLCIVAYLLGAIPTAILIGKLFFKKDIRQYGSGNSGATNALRVFGPLVALFVLSIDVLKGFVAVSLSTNPEIQFFLCLSVLAGHILPIFADFKGGKGVSTTFGCFAAINPQFIILPLIVYITTLIITRISSLSSILAIFSFVISGLFIPSNILICMLLIIVCSIILHTHRENIERIIIGKEKKLF